MAGTKRAKGRPKASNGGTGKVKQSTNTTSVSSTNKQAPSKKKGPSKKDVFPFTDLPAELRNTIYELVTVEAQEISFDNFSTYGFAYSPFLSQPSITRVSRQLRNECLPIFYGLNVFACDVNLSMNGTVSEMSSYFDHIGPSNCKLITKLHVHFGGWVYLTIDSLTSWVAFHTRSLEAMPREGAYELTHHIMTSSFFDMVVSGKSEWVDVLMSGLAALGRSLAADTGIRALTIKKKTLEWLENDQPPECEAAKAMVRPVLGKRMRYRSW